MKLCGANFSGKILGTYYEDKFENAKIHIKFGNLDSFGNVKQIATL